MLFNQFLWRASLYTGDRDINFCSGESWPSVHTWSPYFASLRTFLYRKRPSRPTIHRMVGLEGHKQFKYHLVNFSTSSNNPIPCHWHRHIHWIYNSMTLTQLCSSNIQFHVIDTIYTNKLYYMVSLTHRYSLNVYIPRPLARNCTHRSYDDPRDNKLSFEKQTDPRIKCMWPGWSTNREAEGNTPWWVTTSHWLVPMTGSPIHNKSRGNPWRVTARHCLVSITGSTIQTSRGEQPRWWVTTSHWLGPIAQ
jgi:hypothetical protein